MHLNHKIVTIAPTGKSVLFVYATLFTLWSLYRAFFHTSIWVEEFFIKGAIFLLPLIILPLTSHEPIKALGLTTTHFFKSVSLGIAVGIALGITGIVANAVRYQAFSPSFFQGLSTGQVGAYLILGLITAFWEQLLFSGYFLAQFKISIKKEITLVGVVGLLFSLIHLPAYILVQHQSPSQLIINLLLLITLGSGCAILQLRTKNLIAPIMAHVLWGVTLFIFR